MAGELYLHDSYKRETQAHVTQVIDERFIVLDKTVFYAQGGGQPGDTGTLTYASTAYTVLNTTKKDGVIMHEVDKPGLQVGDTVLAVINWDRRYKLMRYHTAAHLLSTVVHEHAGALITGNQISEDKLRIDFSLEAYDPLKMQHYIDFANKIIDKHLDVHVRFMPREEALAVPGMVKLAGALPPSIAELRIVTIGSGEDVADEQADGGTHVRNTKEIGRIQLVSTENKGKANRRIVVTLH
jgi:misacylated tRNA(Ala) deacylase